MRCVSPVELPELQLTHLRERNRIVHRINRAPAHWREATIRFIVTGECQPPPTEHGSAAGRNRIKSLSGHRDLEHASITADWPTSFTDLFIHTPSSANPDA